MKSSAANWWFGRPMTISNSPPALGPTANFLPPTTPPLPFPPVTPWWIWIATPSAFCAPTRKALRFMNLRPRPSRISPTSLTPNPLTICLPLPAFAMPSTASPANNRTGMPSTNASSRRWKKPRRRQIQPNTAWRFCTSFGRSKTAMLGCVSRQNFTAATWRPPRAATVLPSGRWTMAGIWWFMCCRTAPRLRPE